MKVLIVSMSFWPKISPRGIRATELAKALVKMGHDVTVFTCYETEEVARQTEAEFGITTEDYSNGKWRQPGVPGGRLKLAWVKLLRILILYPSIKNAFWLRRFLRDKTGYDVLISLARPYAVHWGVALARAKNPGLATKWIADCGDPFAGNQETRVPLPFYFKFVENWFVGQPDFITVPIEAAVAAYPEKARRKFRIIPQGFDPEEFPDCRDVRNPHPVFLYAGVLGTGVRNPVPLLKMLSETDRKFTFKVYTKNMELFNGFRDRLGAKLEVHDYIPRDQLLVEMSKCDFLLNFQNKGTAQSPSKLIEYAFLGRPVLNVTEDLTVEDLNQFLNGDYSKSMPLPDKEAHNIYSLAEKIVRL